MSRIWALLRGRKLGSLLAGLSFLIVATSGVLSFALPYGARLSGVHTVAGFAFVLAIVIHLAHNGLTWLRYTRTQKSRRPSGVFMLSLVVVGGLLFAAYTPARPVERLLAWGTSLRTTGQPKPVTYQTLALDCSEKGPLLTLDLKAGPWFSFVEPTYGFHITPQIAAWVEDEHGGFVDTLYVTRDESRSGYDEGDDKHTLSPRPAALPVWAHKLGVQHGKTPLEDRHATAPDVVSAASPTDNVYLVARSKVDPHARFAVLVELNSSFDYNDYYRPSSFPDEPAYANGGNPAQPSVVYRV